MERSLLRAFNVKEKLGTLISFGSKMLANVSFLHLLSYFNEGSKLTYRFNCFIIKIIFYYFIPKP